MSTLDVIHRVSIHGGGHVEIVPFGNTVNRENALTKSVHEECQRLGIEVSNYAMASDFTQDNQDEYENELGRVDTANAVGAKRMRFDVA